MDDIWHSLSRFQSQDIIRTSYWRLYGKDASEERVSEINACFKQGQEFFRSAFSSEYTIKPLLQYYGIVSLAKGTTLLISDAKEPSVLKPSHGLTSIDWRKTLKSTSCSLFDLSIHSSKGLFTDFIRATNNKSYSCIASEKPNRNIHYPIVEVGSEFNFLEIAQCFPDLTYDYFLATDTGKPRAYIENYSIENGQYTLFFNYGLGLDYMDELFGFSHKDLEIEDDGQKRRIKLPQGKIPFLVQCNREIRYRMRTIQLVPPLKCNQYINTLGLFFIASYYLSTIVRYFPSLWVSLNNGTKGDRALPLLNKLIALIENEFPYFLNEFIYREFQTRGNPTRRLENKY